MGLGRQPRRITGHLRPVIPILGARKREQFRDNLNCLKWSLTARQLAQLDEVSQIKPGFPTDFLQRPFVRDYLPGGLYDRIDK